jgi:biopolymer transport protein ExbD
MSGSSSPERADPNLTPILDMVFQLITFFMLVINFKTASMDLSLRLPAVGTARPVELKNPDLLVLNVDRSGSLRSFGRLVSATEIPQYIKTEATVSWQAARRSDSALKFGDELPSMVVIRADKATPFTLLYHVLSNCQEFGYRNFSLKALNRVQEP